MNSASASLTGGADGVGRKSQARGGISIGGIRVFCAAGKFWSRAAGSVALLSWLSPKADYRLCEHQGFWARQLVRIGGSDKAVDRVGRHCATCVGLPQIGDGQVRRERSTFRAPRHIDFATDGWGKPSLCAPANKRARVMTLTPALPAAEARALLWRVHDRRMDDLQQRKSPYEFKTPTRSPIIRNVGPNVRLSRAAPPRNSTRFGTSIGRDQLLVVESCRLVAPRPRPASSSPLRSWMVGSPPLCRLATIDRLFRRRTGFCAPCRWRR